MTIQDYTYKYLVDHMPSNYEYNEQKIWRNRIDCVTNGIGKRSYGDGEAMSKSWMVSTLQAPD